MVLLPYTGRLVSKESEGTPEEPDPETRFEWDAETWLDGCGPENLARRINHSCAPNCEVRRERSGLQVIAMEAILPGVELTLDYGYTPTEALGAPCRCGLPGCVGYRVGRAWRGGFFRLLASLRRRGD